jgi:hypothetical protein
MEALDTIKEGIFLLDFELDEDKEEDIVRRELFRTKEHCNSKACDVIEEAHVEVSNKGLPATKLGTLIFSNHPLECMVGPDRSTSLPGQSLPEIFAAGS